MRAAGLCDLTSTSLRLALALDLLILVVALRLQRVVAKRMEEISVALRLIIK